MQNRPASRSARSAGSWGCLEPTSLPSLRSTGGLGSHLRSTLCVARLAEGFKQFSSGYLPRPRKEKFARRSPRSGSLRSVVASCETLPFHADLCRKSLLEETSPLPTHLPRENGHAFGGRLSPAGLNIRAFLEEFPASPVNFCAARVIVRATGQKFHEFCEIALPSSVNAHAFCVNGVGADKCLLCPSEAIQPLAQTTTPRTRQGTRRAKTCTLPAQSSGARVRTFSQSVRTVSLLVRTPSASVRKFSPPA